VMSKKVALLNPDSPLMNRKAPGTFRVKFETSKGEFVMEINRDWAPLGADRFFNLVKNGYYDGDRFFRVIKDRWTQTGIHGDPQIAALWRNRTFADEPRRESNVRGTVAFAFAVPNGRTTQIFINTRDNQETVRVLKQPDVRDRFLNAGVETVGSSPEQFCSHA